MRRNNTGTNIEFALFFVIGVVVSISKKYAMLGNFRQKCNVTTLCCMKMSSAERCDRDIFFETNATILFSSLHAFLVFSILCVIAHILHRNKLGFVICVVTFFIIK